MNRMKSGRAAKSIWLILEQENQPLSMTLESLGYHPSTQRVAGVCGRPDTTCISDEAVRLVPGANDHPLWLLHAGASIDSHARASKSPTNDIQCTPMLGWLNAFFKIFRASRALFLEVPWRSPRFSLGTGPYATNVWGMTIQTWSPLVSG